uniref:Kinesin-like protein n=1 Tax=Hanusia phi TaxID=3032 RepID=A0A7S0HXP6_9CRYP
MHFDYDAVLDMNGTQDDVYNLAAKPVVDDYLEGYNGTILTYGQTGSGKTYTMEGEIEDVEKRGLLPRMICAVFDYMERSGEHMQFMIQVQFLEIYNEKIRDLLSPEKDNLKIREDKAGGIYVEGATSHYITTEMEVQQALEAGASSRATAETLMNQASSRSHSIFIVTLEQTNTLDGSRKKSKLFMVDLAGSETVKKTGAEGATLKEAQHINKSLSALSNVIFALSEGKATHIPYRDSKLTRLLQEALGGNCRTALIINCSPAKINESETISTMRFGKSAKRIKNRAHINKEQSPAELKMLLAEMQRQNRELQSVIASKDFEIEALKAGGGGDAGGGGGVSAQKFVDVKEELDRERVLRKEAENRVKLLEDRLQEREIEFQDELDELRNEVDKKDFIIAQKDQELDKATLSLKDIAERSCAVPGLNEGSISFFKEQLQILQELAGKIKGTESDPEDAVKSLQDCVSSFSQKLSEKLQMQPDAEREGMMLGMSSSYGHRYKELEEELKSVREELSGTESKYRSLLEEKIENADEYVKSRMLKAEGLNSELIKKAKEDAKLLEARELEIQIFEKRLVKNTQRIKILELLLQDTKAKYEQMKLQEGGVSHEQERRGARMVKGAHRPIQGGKREKLNQLQEGLVHDTKDSPVEAVRAFIKRIAGKD